VDVRNLRKEKQNSREKRKKEGIKKGISRVRAELKYCVQRKEKRGVFFWEKRRHNLATTEEKKESFERPTPGESRIVRK